MQKHTPSLKISEKDNLLVALKDLMPGKQVITDNESFNLTEKIPAKHKFAGQNFSAGDLAYMYGVLVGEATCPIQVGDRITIENLIHRSAEFSAGKGSKSWTSPSTKKWKNKTFMDIIEVMVRLEPLIIGWLCPWSFAKMEILKSLKDP